MLSSLFSPWNPFSGVAFFLMAPRAGVPADTGDTAARVFFVISVYSFESAVICKFSSFVLVPICVYIAG